MPGTIHHRNVWFIASIKGGCFAIQCCSVLFFVFLTSFIAIIGGLYS